MTTEERKPQQQAPQQQLQQQQQQQQQQQPQQQQTRQPSHQPASAAAQSTEQLRYATLLALCTRIGLLVLLLSFAAYVTGVLEPMVPLQRLPELWSQPVGSYLAQTQMPTGWGWLALVLPSQARGDVVGLLGIAVLAGCSVPCLLALVPHYWRRGDKAFAALCLAEAAVVVLAASGLVSGGH